MSALESTAQFSKHDAVYDIVCFLLAGFPNLGGLDIGSLLSNPAVMNMVSFFVFFVKNTILLIS